jgi:hypothetical protein
VFVGHLVDPIRHQWAQKPMGIRQPKPGAQSRSLEQFVPCPPLPTTPQYVVRVPGSGRQPQGDASAGHSPLQMAEFAREHPMLPSAGASSGASPVGTVPSVAAPSPELPVSA